MRAAVRVVFQPLHFGHDAVLVAAEIYHAIVLLVAAALMAGGDMAAVIAPASFRFPLHQRRIRRALVQLRAHYFDYRAAPWRGRFYLDKSHYLFSPAAKLISCPGFRHT